MNSGEPEAAGFGVLRHSRRSSRETGRFGAPATGFRAAASISLGRYSSIQPFAFRSLSSARRLRPR